MPTYDYKCKDCGATFELFQKMTDEPIKECIKCGGEVKRLIGAGLTPIFKGSGFYETDYKTKKKPENKGTKSLDKTNDSKAKDSKPSKKDESKKSA